MTTAPNNAKSAPSTKLNHGSQPDEVGSLKVRGNPHSGLVVQKETLKSANRGISSRDGRLSVSKTGVDLLRPGKPPQGMVTQPQLQESVKGKRSFIHQKMDLDLEGESLRKLRFRLKTLSESISSVKRRCNPFHYLKHTLTSVKHARIQTLQKIKDLLVGGLVFTDRPVGTYLSRNVQMVVASPSLYTVRQIVSGLPYTGTSYTMTIVKSIVSLLKKAGACHRSLRL